MDQNNLKIIFFMVEQGYTITGGKACGTNELAYERHWF